MMGKATGQDDTAAKNETLSICGSHGSVRVIAFLSLCGALCRPCFKWFWTTKQTTCSEYLPCIFCQVADECSSQTCLASEGGMCSANELDAMPTTGASTL